MAVPMSMAKMVSSRVTGRRERISSETGVAVRKDSPMSPTASRLTQSQNWT